jgi:hypothetical protein
MKNIAIEVEYRLSNLKKSVINSIACGEARSLRLTVCNRILDPVKEETAILVMDQLTHVLVKELGK